MRRLVPMCFRIVSTYIVDACSLACNPKWQLNTCISRSRSRVSVDLKSVFEGKDHPEQGTFLVLTAQEHVQYQTSVRWRMNWARVERMKSQSLRWSMIVYRSDRGIIGERF